MATRFCLFLVEWTFTAALWSCLRHLNTKFNIRNVNAVCKTWNLFCFSPDFHNLTTPTCRERTDEGLVLAVICAGWFGPRPDQTALWACRADVQPQPDAYQRGKSLQELVCTLDQTADRQSSSDVSKHLSKPEAKNQDYTNPYKDTVCPTCSSQNPSQNFKSNEIKFQSNDLWKLNKLLYGSSVLSLQGTIFASS